MSFDFGTNSSKMIAIAAAVIAISLFDFSCKKNDSSSPSNPSVIITGNVKNNITNSSNTAEVNDDIHVNATGYADPKKTQGFDIFRVGLYNGNERVVGLKISGALIPGHGIEYVLNLSGDSRIGSIGVGNTLDIRVEYSMANDGEMKYQTIGTMKISAEKDYLNIENSYNISKEKISELSSILSDDSVIHQSGKHFDYDFIVSELNKLVDGIETNSNNELEGVSIRDDTGGNNADYNAGSISFHRTDGYNDTFFTNSEAIMQKLKDVYNLK